MFSFLLLFFCIIFDVESNPVSSLNKCPVGKNDCIKNAVTQFYDLILEPNEALGAEQMDPMFQNIIEKDLDILKFKLINFTTVGYRTCKVKEATYDPAMSTFQIQLFCQKFDLEGKYEMKGLILTEPADGDGDFLFNCGNYKLTVDFKIEKILSDGKNYLKIKGLTFKSEPIGKCTFHLSNLFGGDKEAGGHVNKFVNDNWKVVVIAFQDQIFQPNLKKVAKNANKYLKTLPLD